MSEALAAPPPAPETLGAAHAAAQARIRRHLKGACYHGTYLPLADLVNACARSGPHSTEAGIAACREVTAADDDMLALMLFHQRAAPSVPTGQQFAQERAEAGFRANRAHEESMRPRPTVAELLALWERRGFRFATNGDSLRMTAPPGVATDADRAQIREMKPAILAHLNDQGEVF